MEDTKLPELYLLSIFIGVCSAYHHAYCTKYSIFIDWIPIALTMVITCGYYQIFYYLTLTTWTKVMFAVFVLLNDHSILTIPVPWGMYCGIFLLVML